MKKILIIDDEIHIVELLKFNLENNGYKVDYSYVLSPGYYALYLHLLLCH